MSKFLAVITVLNRYGKPVDPGYGVPGGSPDNTLPGGEYPVDPGYGVGEGRPDQGLPGAPPIVSHPIFLPGRPTHPIYPVGGPGRPSHPIYPVLPVDPGWSVPEGPPTGDGVYLPIFLPPEINNGLPSPPFLGWLPVDPGWGIPVAPPRPDNSLPGGDGVWLPIDPGYGVPVCPGGGTPQPKAWVYVPKINLPSSKGK